MRPEISLGWAPSSVWRCSLPVPPPWVHLEGCRPRPQVTLIVAPAPIGKPCVASAGDDLGVNEALLLLTLGVLHLALLSFSVALPFPLSLLLSGPLSSCALLGAGQTCRSTPGRSALEGTLVCVVQQDAPSGELLVDVSKSREDVVPDCNVDGLGVAGPLPQHEEPHIAPKRKKHPGRVHQVSVSRCQHCVEKAGA